MRLWPFAAPPTPARRRADHVHESLQSPSRLWLPGILLGLVGALLVAVVPNGDTAWTLAYLLTSLISLVVLFGAALAMPPGVRVVWWLLFAFEVLVMGAHAAYDAQTASAQSGDAPALADIAYLAVYAPAFLALAILIRRLNPGRDREAWIDSSILTVAAVSVFGLFLVMPILTDYELRGPALLVALAYPVLDLALLSCLIWLLVGTGRPHIALGLLACSFAVTLSADVVRDLALASGGDSPSAWLDAFRLVGLVLMAGAATSTTADTIDTPRERQEPRVTTPRLAVLAIGVLAVPSLVAARLWGDPERLTLLLSLSAIIIIILAVWRIRVLVSTVEQQRRVTELVLDSAGDGIVGLDRQGFVLFANVASRRMLRCRESDLVGRRFHDVAHHEHPDGTPFPWHECPVRKLIATGGEAYIPDQVYVRRDGTTFPVEIVISPLVVEGTLMGAVQSFRDVSERTEMDEMKRQFVSVVSHELRTPLTSIKGSLQMLDSGLIGPLTDDQQELVAMAVTNSDRLGQLVNDILDLERLDAGRMPLTPEDVSATDLARQSAGGITGAATAAGVRLIVEAPDDTVDVLVHVDPHRMLQVLTNLLGNAIKFSERDSTVRVIVSRADDDITIAVADSGRGIPPDQLEAVFDRFGQVDARDSRRQGGTGLGLAIAREIVERSGGRISVTSIMGVGSTFTVHLHHTTTAPDLAEVTA